MKGVTALNIDELYQIETVLFDHHTIKRIDFTCNLNKIMTETHRNVLVHRNVVE